jgi:hypothetical protein
MAPEMAGDEQLPVPSAIKRMAMPYGIKLVLYRLVGSVAKSQHRVEYDSQ